MKLYSYRKQRLGMKKCDWCHQESDREHTWFNGGKKWMCSFCGAKTVKL